jgi:hypothetical protein
MPTYVLLSSQVTKGYKGCLASGLNTSCRHSQKLAKMIYESHHKWLPKNHPSRSNTSAFNGRTERRLAPQTMTRVDVFEHANSYDTWKINGEREKDNPIAQTRMKRSILFNLLY